MEMMGDGTGAYFGEDGNMRERLATVVTKGYRTGAQAVKGASSAGEVQMIALNGRGRILPHTNLTQELHTLGYLAGILTASAPVVSGTNGYRQEMPMWYRQIFLQVREAIERISGDSFRAPVVVKPSVEAIDGATRSAQATFAHVKIQPVRELDEIRVQS